MSDRLQVTDEQSAWDDLGSTAARISCLERDNCLPFHLLSDDAFEICCYVLLIRENHAVRAYYYGKTGDKGRDIVCHHADGTVEFIQCKRYSGTVGVGEVRRELAKLCVNTFEGRLPEKPDRVTFYVVPDLSSDAQDLLTSQEEWKAASPKAIEEHLRTKPAQELLDFAATWWPKFDRVTGPSLGARVEQHPTLLDRFFAVKKVIEGSREDLRNIQDQLRGLNAGLANAGLASAVPSQGTKSPDSDGTSAPLTKAQELVGRSQIKRLEELARRSLDAQGQRLWDEIRGEIRGLNHLRALDSGERLREWLTGDGAHASPLVRGRACILLADLAVIGSAITSQHERIDVADARAWQTRALAEFGAAPAPEDAARLVYLDARLTWIEGRLEEALTLLDAADDPNCQSLKLSILLSEERDSEAVALARTLPLDDRWCDRVVMAYARAGQPDDAAPVYSWAEGRSEPAVYPRCLIAWAQGTMQRLFRDREPRSLFIDPLPADEAEALRDILADLEPLVAPATARGQPASGLETESLELTFVVSRLLAEQERWRRYGTLLGKAKPVSLEYARAVSRGDLPDTEGLAARLRTDYPRSFVAGYLAAVIDSLRGVGFVAISEAVDALSSLAEDDEQRGRLVELLSEAALREEGVAAIEQARQSAIRFLGDDHRLVRTLTCECLRRGGRTDEAEALLEASRDEADPLWLQQAAAFEYRRGDRPGALHHLRLAARQLGRRETCRQVLSLAQELNDGEAMREMLGLLARLCPEDPTVPRNLAVVEFRDGHFKEAAVALQQVERLTPGVAENGLYLGQALTLAGRGGEAVHVLNRYCAIHPAFFPLHQLRALVLDSVGKPVLAFEGLHAVRDRFWGEMHFVGLYHTLAYKVNREEDAHLAFLRIQELQNGDPNGPLRSATLDDLREFSRRDGQRHVEFNRQVLVGRLPWSMVGRALRREAYLDWAIRTQETLVPDAPVAKAEYAVYATHGYTVRTADGSEASLQRITTPPQGRPVVVELSALLTLHRLGLLDHGLSYFGRVVLPAGYLPRFLEEHRSLQPHQLSQVEARRALVAAVDNGRLRVAPAGTEGVPPLPVLDEHHLEEDPAEFHLADAMQWMHRTGRLSDAEQSQIGHACGRPRMADDCTVGTAMTRGLVVRVITLITVHQLGLLDRFLAGVKPFVQREEIEELRQALLGEERRAELNRWTRELHAAITGDTRIESDSPRRPEGTDEEEGAQEHDPSIDAVLLADQRQLPLLTDDRCLQAIVLNSHQGRAGAASGTDQLLIAMASAGTITPSDHAAAWLQLVRWRYRFLLPTPEILLTLAARHPTFPPGEELREACRYLHDCCLDPGLLCGLEPTEPPMSIGLWYFQDVVHSVGQFLMRAWHDYRFDDRAVRAITLWAAGELLPPPPRPLPYAAYVVACDAAPRLLLVSALAESIEFRNPARSNMAMVAIAEALGIGTDDYDEIMTTLVEADLAPTDAPEYQAADRALRRLLAISALQHRQGMGLRSAAVLAEIDLLPSLADEMPEAEVAVLRDPSHPRRDHVTPGPWVFVRGEAEGQSNVARYTPDLIFHPMTSVRQAAVAHLSSAPAAHPAWLAPRSQQTVAATAADLCSENPTSSRTAACALAAALTRDFILDLARFRQARASQLEPENTDSFRSILEARGGTLHSIPPSWHSLPGDEWDGVCNAAAEELTLSNALDRFYERYGHLPLAAPHAAELIVERWTAIHGTEGAWDSVWSWAQDEGCPLKRYHACRVFLSNPSLVPDEGRDEVWSIVSSLLDGYAGEGEERTVPALAWHMVHGLARHYLQTLEVDSPEADATSLTTLAWWAAERATRELVRAALPGATQEEAARVLRRVLVRGVQRAASRSSMSRLLARPARSPSSFAYGTLTLASLWRTALLEAGPGIGLPLSADHAEAVFTQLALGLGVGYPPRGGPPRHSGLAFDVPLSEVIARWLAAVPGGAGSESLAPEGPREAAFSASPDLGARVRAIWEMEEEVWMLTLQQLRAGVGLGSLDLQEIVWLLEDKAWWDRAFQCLSDDLLGVLFGVLYDLLRAAEQWSLGLPHLFRMQALRQELPTERQAAAAGAVLHSCLISGNTSAIAYLVRESMSPELHDCFRDWRRRLADISRVSPSPLQARIRSVLALLPSDPGSPT